MTRTDDLLRAADPVDAHLLAAALDPGAAEELLAAVLAAPPPCPRSPAGYRIVLVDVPEIACARVTMAVGGGVDVQVSGG